MQAIIQGIKSGRRWWITSLAMVWVVFGQSILAQDKFGGGGFDSFDGLGLPTVVSDPMEFTTTYQLEKGGLVGRLIVEATIADGYHAYSTTQPKGVGPYPTAITVKHDTLKSVGAFQPDRDPKIGYDEVAYPGLKLEEFYGSVTWTAPIELSTGADPSKVNLAVAISALVCKEACQPVDAELEAKFDGFYAPPKRSDSLRVENTHAVWTAKLVPQRVKPGDTAVIEITSNTDVGYHVYEAVPGDEETNFRTLIVPARKSGLKFGEPVTEAEVVTDSVLDYVKYYKGDVTWKIPVQVPADVEAGTKAIEIQVGFLTCNEGSCDEPSALLVSGNLEVGSSSSTDSLPLGLTVAKYRDVVEQYSLALESAEPAAPPAVVDADAPDDEPVQGLSVWHVLAGLAGGFILNFMPCVLPVIGLKVMSFMTQAGNSRSRIIGLNLAYVGGILAVMLILALVTVAAKMVWGNAFGWGEQFTHLEFKVVLACLVFAMALSFLGVWEIPIPGFATSTRSGELMDKEGPMGAFLKGVLTTVLATPCSGPLLGSLFGLSLVLSPLSVILLYCIVGLGMGMPFLLLCIWPDFVKRLPKPGAWMETLKQALAFPLLLTAVFFVASIDNAHRIATLVLLIVVWFACWLIGKAPAYDRKKVFVSWAFGIATVGLGAFVSFATFGPLKSDLDWIPYSEPALAKYRAEGRTVMLDFTANWCLNCQINTRVAIDKENVARLVDQNEVITMLADWTDRSDEIRSKLDELQSNSIPLLAIYPPDPQAPPILLRDLLTESDVIEALEEAGPSQEATRLISVSSGSN